MLIAEDYNVHKEVTTERIQILYPSLVSTRTGNLDEYKTCRFLFRTIVVIKRYGLYCGQRLMIVNFEESGVAY